MEGKNDILNISVLIISFNCWDLLHACLKSINASDCEVKEIIIIDNDSEDETRKNLQQFYPDVKLIKNDENVGHTKAVNQGCKIANGEFILLLDADTEVEPDCISLMHGFLKQHPKVSMVAPKTYLADGVLQDSAKNFPTPINGIFGRQSLLTRFFPNNPFAKRYLVLQGTSISEPIQVEHVSAACMLFRQETYKRIGGWDESYHSYWVDADWCKKIQLLKGQTYYIPDAVIIHHEQNHRSLKKHPLRIIKFHTGAYRFYRKHYTRGRLDPRSIFAACLLSLRATLHLTRNYFKKSSTSRIDPLSLNKKKSAVLNK